MPLVTICLRLHQPFRLSPENATSLWDEKNREVFTRRAELCYLPITRMFTGLVRTQPSFKISCSISGTFLEQAELYQPKVIDALRELLDSAGHRGQVEFLEELTTILWRRCFPTRRRPNSRSRCRSTGRR